MIDDGIANSTLGGLLDRAQFAHNAWHGQPFEKMKLASATEKGNLGEDFLVAILRRAGYGGVEMPEGRRGQYDVQVRHGSALAQFEVKVATRDIRHNYQFNGIRYDTDYTHLFCLGVAPATVGFLVVAKGALGRPPYKMVSMARGSNSSFKLKMAHSQMLGFGDFCTQMAEVMGP